MRKFVQIQTFFRIEPDQNKGVPLLAKICSCSASGIDGCIVDVEVDISYGLPAFHIVGLPEVSIRESKDRVKSAINNSGYTFPMERVVVNLAPADIKKEGTGFDLPIGVSILAASGLIPADPVSRFVMAGELSLDGRVKPVNAVLSFALAARENGFKGIIIPGENADEAAMVQGIDVLPVQHLSEVVEYFSGFRRIEPHQVELPVSDHAAADFDIDFLDVKGQQQARRALEIAAAGFHSVLMVGPPGSGKSMMAKRLATILPELAFEEALDVMRIYSVMGLLDHQKLQPFSRPFRSPHHTISDAGLVGGGSRPMPGEISLAHNGVLFLDELPEFKKNVLEVLRQPLEEGAVSISRAGTKAIYPARVMLVAAMNPCPCGFFSDPAGQCTCTVTQIHNYRAKISGPLLDRIDMHIDVPRLAYHELSDKTAGESSALIRARVAAARSRQESRFAGAGLSCNSKMNVRQIKTVCRLDPACDRMLAQAVDILGFSARACHSVLRVARTIADLDQTPQINTGHLAEAIQYRSFDRQAG